MKIILASTSQNRKKLLDNLGIKYEIHVPNYQEKIIKNESPIIQIQNFAKGKANSVYEKLKNEDNFLIAGFDSMVEFEGKSFGKPKSKTEAFEMLKSFRGKKQNIMSGVALIGKINGKKFESIFYESSEVLFKKNITDQQIQQFLEFNDWQGKCGAYSVFGMAIFFLEYIKGDIQNIIGIPLSRMGQEIEKITGKNIFEIFKPQ